MEEETAVRRSRTQQALSASTLVLDGFWQFQQQLATIEAQGKSSSMQGTPCGSFPDWSESTWASIPSFKSPP
jgi:hypothetical protein